jgi:hypothetical protein
MADPLNLQQLVSTLQQINISIGALNTAISTSTSAIFPATTGTSATAAAGAIASPGDFVGFISVKLPNGTIVKVPYFD